MFRTLTFTILVLAGCATAPTTKPLLLSHQLSSQIDTTEPAQLVTKVPQSVMLEWNPPPEPDASQVVSYRLYMASESNLMDASMIPVGNFTNAVVDGLVGGSQVYFAVTDLGPNGESDFSEVLPYTPQIVLDLKFAFGQPVTNVVLQVSPDLIQWQDFGMIPTNGVWRITANPNSPIGFFRGKATTQ